MTLNFRELKNRILRSFSFFEFFEEMVFQELVSSRSLDWVSSHTSGEGGGGERGVVGGCYKNLTLRHSWETFFVEFTIAPP